MSEYKFSTVFIERIKYLNENPNDRICDFPGCSKLHVQSFYYQLSKDEIKKLPKDLQPQAYMTILFFCSEAHMSLALKKFGLIS